MLLFSGGLTLDQNWECRKTLHQKRRIFQFPCKCAASLHTHVIDININDRRGRINDTGLRVAVKGKESNVVRDTKVGCGKIFCNTKCDIIVFTDDGIWGRF